MPSPPSDLYNFDMKTEYYGSTNLQLQNSCVLYGHFILFDSTPSHTQQYTIKEAQALGIAEFIQLPVSKIYRTTMYPLLFPYPDGLCIVMQELGSLTATDRSGTEQLL